MSDTWPNGVPYIDEDTRTENLRSTEALRDLISALWLYIGRHAETQLTTEQKELLADVVEAQTDYGDRNFTYDRWWQRQREETRDRANVEWSGRTVGFSVTRPGGRAQDICPRCFEEGVDNVMSFLTPTTSHPIVCERCGKTIAKGRPGA